MTDEVPADSAWQPSGVAGSDEYKANQQAMNEAFRKGLGDAALSLSEGDTESPYPTTLDPREWMEAEDFHADHAQTIEETEEYRMRWIRAAIQAGYNAARDLDPAMLYIGDEAIPQAEVIGDE